MIFTVNMRLEMGNGTALMPFNYQYPLASAIHHLMRKSDEEYACFFHDVGYSNERYKLFTFSDIKIPFIPKQDRMLLLGDAASFKACFHVPEAAQHFVKGAFLSEQIVIGDRISEVRFKVQEIESCLLELPQKTTNPITVVVQPISPMVVGSRSEYATSTTYHSPYELAFTDRLTFSWIQKYKAVSGLSEAEVSTLRQMVRTEVLFGTLPPVERRITIKDGSDNAQKVRGYIRFGLRLTAPTEMIELALNSGLGIKNSIGMGCLQLVN